MNRGGARSAGDDRTPAQRVGVGLVALLVVLVFGTVGYLVLGLDLLDAAYQTITTVGTVGFREIGEVTAAWKVFTMVLVLLGAGTVLYTLTVVLEVLLEGRLTDQLWRRRMQREIDRMTDHVIVCGAGRLGRTVAEYLDGGGQKTVVVDKDPQRLVGISQPFVEGDATDDAVLEAAGLARARALVAATDADTANLYITLSARSARNDLFIVARARLESAEPKLRQAGADRVVNPQAIGGSRIAALTLQPHVAEFVDIVMHDGSLEFRLEEVEVPPGSAVADQTLRQAGIREKTGAMVLALRDPDGSFITNPGSESTIHTGQVLIAIGTKEQLQGLSRVVRSGEGR